jgi:predicted O-linked N-acetylglucosamine transferase (SPINDLY family)
MREKVLNSPIFNSKRFSRNFEKGLWDMWKKNKIIKKFLD